MKNRGKNSGLMYSFTLEVAKKHHYVGKRYNLVDCQSNFFISISFTDLNYEAHYVHYCRR